MTRAESRAIVRRLAQERHLGTVREILRPRGLSGLWRSRPPLWLVLLLADRDGQLLRDGNAFAVREPARAVRGRARSTWLRRLDHAWDTAVFLLPPSILLLVAAVLAVTEPGGRSVVAPVLVMAVLAMLWIAVVLGMMIVQMMYHLLRRQPVRTAVDQLRRHNATVTVLDAPTPGSAAALITRAVAAGGPLLVLARGITSAPPSDAGLRDLRIESLSEPHDLLVVRRPGDPPPQAPTEPERFRARDTAVFFGSSVASLAIVAAFVPAEERAVCGDDCAGFLTTYGDTLYWMANRLFGGDPNGLGVSSPFGRTVGLLVTVYGLYVLVAIVGSVVRQRIADDLRSAADVVAAYQERRGGDEGYAPGRPHGSGVLDVGDGQHLYWETRGNPTGAAALVLHDGPGFSITEHTAGLLDPDSYRIVLFDQRGCGASAPDAADAATRLDTNTTGHQIADIERLRTHLDVEQWLVLGGAWGSTLALAYAQRHPSAVSALVLFSVVGTTRSEIDWVTRGMRRFLPVEWERFRSGVAPADRDGDLADAYARLLTDTHPEVRDRAAREWCAWEERRVAAATGPRSDPRFAEPTLRSRYARLVTHYWRHGAWLGEDELVDGAHRLAGIPGVLINDRADMSRPPEFAHSLSRVWPGSQLIMVDTTELGRHALVRTVTAATDRFRPTR